MKYIFTCIFACIIVGWHSKPQSLKRFLLLIAISTLLGCSNSVNTDIDESILPTLKKFEQAYANQEIVGGSNWIVESNFNSLLQFIDKNLKDEVYLLLKSGKINRIEIWDKKCILFRIHPTFNNSLTKSRWEELYIAFYDDCPCVCHRRINQIDVPKEKILAIEKNWYKVVALNKRYIGG